MQPEIARVLQKPLFALPGCQQISVNTLVCDTLGLAELQCHAMSPSISGIPILLQPCPTSFSIKQVFCRIITWASLVCVKCSYVRPSGGRAHTAASCLRDSCTTWDSADVRETKEGKYRKLQWPRSVNRGWRFPAKQRLN